MNPNNRNQVPGHLLKTSMDSTISTFKSEAQMVAAICRVAATLPQQVRERLNFGNGEPQVLQVLETDTRRNDGVFFCNGKVYGAEFKRGMLEPHHLYETLVGRHAGRPCSPHPSALWGLQSTRATDMRVRFVRRRCRRLSPARPAQPSAAARMSARC